MTKQRDIRYINKYFTPLKYYCYWTTNEKIQKQFTCCFHKIPFNNIITSKAKNIIFKWFSNL